LQAFILDIIIFNVFLPIKKAFNKKGFKLASHPPCRLFLFYMRREQRQWELKLTIKASRGLVPRARHNWTTNYEDEKWKIPCFYALTEKDREDVKRRGLVREYPTANYYGLEVKTDLKLPKS
jgi:hypothetical protein